MNKAKIQLLINSILIIVITATGWTFYRTNYLIKKPISIGSSYMTMNNEFYPILHEQVANYVDEHNDFLYNRDPALNVNKQIEEIHSFERKGVNAILLNPVDGNCKKLNQAISAAHKKGIKIVIVDSQVKTKQVDCTITSANYHAGVLCARELMQNKKHARILLLEHRTAISAVERINGFVDTIKRANNKNYQIVGHLQTYGQSEISYPKTRQFIKSGPRFDTIMSLNDRAGIGALAAINANHLDDLISVYSIDGSEDMKKMISQNSSAVATVAQSPIKMGQKAIRITYQLIAGKKIPKRIYLPIKIIDRKNINQYNVTGWQ